MLVLNQWYPNPSEHQQKDAIGQVSSMEKCQGKMGTRIMLRLKRCSCPIKRSMDSRNSTVHMPPMVSKLMSTTILSTKHFSSFTCIEKGSNALLCKQRR